MTAANSMYTPASRLEAVAAAEGPNDLEELSAIEEQVGQARAILSDAIRKLASNFRVLDHQTASQKMLIQEILDAMSSTEGAPRQAATQRVSVQAFARETSDVLHQLTDLLATVSTQSVRTVYRIDDMARELDAVFKLVASINEISEETFILAVNATIEAAHADGGGRSFSVIAANVRELSKKTRRFNEQIESQIVKASRTVAEVREIIGDMASRDLNVALAGKERVQEMLAQLQAFELFVGESLDKATALTAQIRAAADEAVTALQCEDILMQILQGIESRVEIIRKNGGGRVHATTAAERSLARAPAPTALEAIQQRSMKPGDVELF